MALTKTLDYFELKSAFDKNLITHGQELCLLISEFCLFTILLGTIEFYIASPCTASFADQNTGDPIAVWSGMILTKKAVEAELIIVH